MDYRRTRVQVLVVRNNHMLMVRDLTDDGISLWRLPGADLEEGDLPEDGVERAIATETGMEGKVLDFLHRKNHKEGPYRIVLTYLGELRERSGSMGFDPRERTLAPGALEVSWRSLRNPELREQFEVILKRAHL